MASNIDAHFIEQYESELYVAFQNKGGVMRSRVRRKTGVIGLKTNFPKIGTAPAAQPKTRRGKVPLLDILRDRVPCELVDRYGADMIDDLDTLKTNVEEKTATQDAIVMSLARSEDDLALAAAITTTNALNNTASDDSFSSDAIPRQILEGFGNAEAIEGGNMHALVTWKAWTDLLAVDTFADSEYGGPDSAMISEGQRPKMYFAFMYAPYSRLPVDAGSGKKLNLWWNKMCLGVAVGKEIVSTTDFLKEYDSHYIMGKMSQGACLIDSTGVVKRRYGG
jgi:Phage capsid protein